MSNLPKEHGQILKRVQQIDLSRIEEAEEAEEAEVVEIAKLELETMVAAAVIGLDEIKPLYEEGCR